MRDKEGKESVLRCVKKFEGMLDDNSSLFFDVDEFEQIAEYYLEKNAFEKAIVLCDYAFSLYPNNSSFILLKGHALIGAGKISDAKDLIFHSEFIGMKSVDLLLLEALVFSRMKEHQKAVNSYLSALGIVEDSMRIEVLFDLISEYQLMNNFSKAIELLSEMIVNYPSNEFVQFELAYCLDKEQQFQKAIELFKKHTDDRPYSYTGWFNLGNFLLKTDQLDDALESFELSCAIKTDYVPSLINCGMIHIIKENYLSGIQYFKEVLAIEEDNDFVLCAIAEAYESLEEFSLATSYYEKALEINSLNSEALFGLALIYFAQEKYNIASSYVDQAIEVDPDHEGILLLLVQTKLTLGESFDVEDIMMDFLANNEEALGVMLELADYYFYYLDDIILAFEVLDDGIFGNIDEKHVLVIRKATYLHIAGQHKNAYNELNFLLSFFEDKEFIVREILKVHPEMILDEVVAGILL